ncbi:MAG: type II secretion system F family protein [Bryobacterales bacterium]|nr:type II secretion system F family protein [Bryobacterales bacterium]
MPAIWWSLFLVIFAFVMIGASLGFRYLETRRKAAVIKTLQTAVRAVPAEEHRLQILSEEEKVPGPMLAALSQTDLYRNWQARIQGAGLKWKPEFLALLILAGIVAGALFGNRFHVLVFESASIAGGAIIGGLLPWLYIESRRKRRLNEFEQQFPEALDFIARAVRAGHAFSVSMELLSTEAPEPIRTEFRTAFHELNLGAPIDKALGNMVERVPLVDVRFFVSTILLQRETGGNLAEILMRLAHIIRERFRLKGQVRAAAAHGRLTATILTLIPIVLAVAFSIVAPDYLLILSRDPDGRIMIFCAIAGQLLGYLTMRWIVNIKV